MSDSLFTAIGAYLDSRPAFIDLAFWLTVILTSLCFITLLYIVLLRIRYNQGALIETRVKLVWEPVFNSVRRGREIIYPDYHDSKPEILLEIWLEERTLAPPDYAARLDAMGHELALDKTICRILKPNSLRVFPDQIWLHALAISAAQWMNTPETQKALRKVVEGENNYLAAKACAILLEVGAENCERLAISTLFRFPKRLPAISSMLGKSGAGRILHLIELFINDLPPYARQNFISLAELSDDTTLAPLIASRLIESEDEEEIAALLRALGNLGDTSYRDYVIPYLTHSSRILRVNAAKAIAKCGTVADRSLLVPLMSDRDWALRYRAATSYVRLTGQDEQHIEALRDSMDDGYARDILKHAYAEQYWCLG